MKRKFRWGSGATFGVLALLLTLASAAYACTTWEGRMTVTAGGGTSEAEGNGGSMQWCDPPSGDADIADSSGQTVTVELAPGSECAFTTQLPAKTYNIRWEAGVWDPQSGGTNCMDSTDPDIGDITVDSNGNSTAAVTTSGFDPNGASNVSICVENGSWGNQVHIAVL